MIVVKVELHSAITGKVTEIGRMLLGNDGTAPDIARGNYDARVLRRRESTLDEALLDDPFAQWQDAPTTRTGRVESFPRLSYNVWRLVIRALKSAFPEEA